MNPHSCGALPIRRESKRRLPVFRRISGAMALCILLPGSGVAQRAGAAAAVPTIAVMDFNAFSLMPGEDAASVGRGLASMIATELATRPTVRVVDRQQLEELVQKRQLSMSGRMEDSQALQLGQLLGAQYVVVGNVALEPTRARIDLRLLNVSTGVIERADRRQGSRDDFLELVTRIADAFTEDLRLPVVAAVVDVAIPAGAALAYSRGLDYERRGETARAVEMYRKALELFPRHEAAASALERVTEQGR